MVTIPQSSQRQSTMLPGGGGYTPPLPKVYPSTPVPKSKSSGGGKSKIPQSTPAGSPPLPPPDIPQSIQRQNVLAEAQSRQADRNLLFQTKQEAPERMSFVSDKPKTVYTKGEISPIVSKGFPIGTQAEALSLKSKGFSLYGIGEESLPQSRMLSSGRGYSPALLKPIIPAESLVGEIDISSQAIFNFQQLRGTGSFTFQQQSIANAKAYSKAYEQTLTQMKVEEFKTEQFPTSKDFGPYFSQVSEKNLLAASGVGKQALIDLPKGIVTKLALQELAVAGMQYGAKTLGSLGTTTVLEGFGGGQILPGEKVGFKTRSKKQYQLGFMSELERTQLGLPGKGLQIGTTLYSLGRGGFASYKLIKQEGLNVGGGMLLEGLSPVQFGFGKGASFKLFAGPLSKSTIIRKVDTIAIQTNYKDPTQPLTSLKLGRIAKGDLTAITSSGRGGYLVSTKIDTFSLPKPQLITTKTPGFLKTGSLTSLGNIKTFEVPTYLDVTLTRKNIQALAQIDEKRFIGKAFGERQVTSYTKELVPKGQYDFELKPKIIRETQYFKGYEKYKITGVNQQGLTKGKSISSFKFKPLSRSIYSFDTRGNLISKELQGIRKGLPGRPSKAFGFGTYQELGKIETPSAKLTLGETTSLVRTRGKSSLIGFKTKYYEAGNNYLNIRLDDKNIFGSGKGQFKTNFNLKNIGLSSKQINKQISSTLTSKSLAPTFKAPKITSSSLGLATSQTSLLGLGLGITGAYATKLTTTPTTLFKPLSGQRLISSQLTAPLTSTSLTTSLKLATTLTPALSTRLTPPTFPSGGFAPGLIATPFTPVIPGFPGLPSLGGDLIPRVRSRGRKAREQRIAPSFTGLSLGIKIKSPVKQSKTFGVTPFQRRGIYKGKGPYSRLTNL